LVPNFGVSNLLPECSQVALNGDPVALIGVLDYAFAQIVGVGFFDVLTVLKAGDYLGQNWYDEAIAALHCAPGFPQVAQASGDFANTIHNLDVLEDAARLDIGDFNAPQIFSANSQR
jgi:hypothetical protein